MRAREACPGAAAGIRLAVPRGPTRCQLRARSGARTGRRCSAAAQLINRDATPCACTHAHSCAAARPRRSTTSALRARGAARFHAKSYQARAAGASVPSRGFIRTLARECSNRMRPGHGMPVYLHADEHPSAHRGSAVTCGSYLWPETARERRRLRWLRLRAPRRSHSPCTTARRSRSATACAVTRAAAAAISGGRRQQACGGGGGGGWGRWTAPCWRMGRKQRLFWRCWRRRRPLRSSSSCRSGRTTTHIPQAVRRRQQRC